MDNEKDMFKKMNMDMIKDWFENDNEQITDNELFLWMDIASYCYENENILKQLLFSIKNDRSSDGDSRIRYSFVNDKYRFYFDATYFEYDKEDICKKLRFLICALESVLPIGTTVRFNKKMVDLIVEELKKDDNTKDILEQKEMDLEKLAVVIVRRFIHYPKQGQYALYLGAIYPLGVERPESMIMFSNEDIGQILSKGYADEKDKAYIYRKKRDYLMEYKLINKEYDI